ncbi:MAG TPA: hypothetical protein VE870_02600 [Bacteroidales bacterium]|nr:hypothetical protein [Bacteroidales bacterium]
MKHKPLLILNYWLNLLNVRLINPASIVFILSGLIHFPVDAQTIYRKEKLKVAPLAEQQR